MNFSARPVHKLPVYFCLKSIKTVGVVNLASPVGVVNLALPVFVVLLASPVGMVNLTPPDRVVNLAQPVAWCSKSGCNGEFGSQICDNQETGNSWTYHVHALVISVVANSVRGSRPGILKSLPKCESWQVRSCFTGKD